MRQIETQNFRRINRRKAETLYNANVPVYLCACNMNPESPWQPAIDVCRPNINAPFEGVVNAFELYHCNGTTGRKAFFYERTTQQDGALSSLSGSQPEQDHIRTGFWVNQDLQNPNFDFMWDLYTGCNSIMDFLHGACTFFALALNDLAGLPMCCVTDVDALAKYGNPIPTGRNFPLIHDFCMLRGGEGSPSLFVDCRGIIDNKRIFLDEFRNLFSVYQIFEYTQEQVKKLKDTLLGPSQGRAAGGLYREAYNYISHHRQDYIPEWI